VMAMVTRARCASVRILTIIHPGILMIIHPPLGYAFTSF
jgi:hypothetical protein